MSDTRFEVSIIADGDEYWTNEFLEYRQEAFNTLPEARAFAASWFASWPEADAVRVYCVDDRGSSRVLEYAER